MLELDAEEEKENQREIEQRFKPLLSWLKIQVNNVVRDGKEAFRHMLRVPLLNRDNSGHFKQTCNEPMCNCSGRTWLHSQCREANK